MNTTNNQIRHHFSPKTQKMEVCNAENRACRYAEHMFGTKAEMQARQTQLDKQQEMKEREIRKIIAEGDPKQNRKFAPAIWELLVKDQAQGANEVRVYDKNTLAYLGTHSSKQWNRAYWDYHFKDQNYPTGLVLEPVSVRYRVEGTTKEGQKEAFYVDTPRKAKTAMNKLAKTGKYTSYGYSEEKAVKNENTGAEVWPSEARNI